MDVTSDWLEEEAPSKMKPAFDNCVDTDDTREHHGHLQAAADPLILPEGVKAHLLSVTRHMAGRGNITATPPHRFPSRSNADAIL